MRTGISERELVHTVALTDMIDALGLTRRGRSFQCPNHQWHSHHDQTPSAYIASTGISWTCHKCNTGGTVVTLIMTAHGLSYDDAKLAIADWAGLPATPWEGRFRSPSISPSPAPAPPRPAAPPAPPADPSVRAYLRHTQRALPGAPAATAYLAQRRIPIATATAAQLGFAAAGTWPNPRGAGQPRLVAPLTAPDGTLLNLYGRSVVPCDKPYRHDFLKGPKGLFNTPAFSGHTVVLVEGVFDALSVLAAGFPATALCGVTIRADWWPLVHADHLILALDADDTGQRRAAELARLIRRLQKQVTTLPPESLATSKDLNDYWTATGMLPAALLALLAQRR